MLDFFFFFCGWSWERSTCFFCNLDQPKFQSEIPK
ncbi:hypothetical protein CMV_027411, partial [Castanea mollissima]